MTIPAPHQLRVLNEEAELAERHTKLCDFLVSDKIVKVSPEERSRLERQEYCMRGYLDVLRERIANF
jgi:hypothetical protein